MMTKEIHSDYPIPPGEFLEEVLEDLGMGKDELARRMNRPAAKLSSIFRGEKEITPATALQIEKVTGIPAHIWTGLESEYRLTLARLLEQKDQETRKTEIPLISKYCYKQLQAFGYVEKKTKPLEKVEELQKFYGVTSLYNLDNVKRYQPFFKQNISPQRSVSSEAIISWLRMGELEAHKIDTKEFNRVKLIELIAILRRMTKTIPSQFQKELIMKFAEAGVSLVIVPHLPKTYAHGATFWLNKNKAVIMTTIRGSWADMFWFCLFHELGHILLHNKQDVYLESDKIEYTIQDIEKEADKFAADNLIPSNEIKEFIKKGSYFRKDIVQFATKIGIHPGIVVGRLQHDNHIDKSWHNDLRDQYHWSKK